MPANPEMRPVPVSIRYTGGMPPTMDQEIITGFLTDKFNQVSDILRKHHASPSIESLSFPVQEIPATVPAKFLQPLTAELKRHDFTLRRMDGPPKRYAPDCRPG